MPEDKAATSAAPPPAGNNNKGGGGGGRSKQSRRKRGGRNRDRSGGGGSKSKGPPQTPTLKVTLRNIHDATQLGTCRQLGESLVRVLIQRANERLMATASSSSSSAAAAASTEDVSQIYIDEASLQKHIDADDASRAAKEAWEEEQALVADSNIHGENVTEPKGAEDQNGLSTKEEEQQDESKAKKDNKKGASVNAAGGGDAVDGKVVEGMEKLQIKNSSNHKQGSAPAAQPTLSSPSAISTRILYMVPPKKTRRRGEKPGCVYLVLTASPIVARQQPKPQPVPPPPLPVLPATGGKILEEHAKAAANEIPAPAAAPVVTAVDYSKDVSQRRLALQLALDALTKCCLDDAKAEQTLAGCVVEESPSAKTWKDRGSGSSSRHDRFEGTLQDSADYKDFFKKSEQAKKDLLARPKPTPGGSAGFVTAAGAGASVTTTNSTIESSSAVVGVGGGVTTTTSTQPVAALVLHLQKKKEEENKRKQSKKKKESASKKGGGKQSPQEAAGGGGANSNKESKRKRKSKKNKKKAAIAVAAAGKKQAPTTATG